VFNIGNISGCGLGLNALLGLPVEYGAGISALIAIAIFLVKEAGRAMDIFVKLLGIVMLGLIIYVVFAAWPPMGEAALRTVWPTQNDARAVVTLDGGTVGGYITFAGAHRLIDAGISGRSSLTQVNKSALTGILLTAAIRFLLFLASFGVLALGLTIDDKNPPASVFQDAAGNFGYRVFGIVMWAAAITSVVGAAFTSVSFFKTFDKRIDAYSNYVIVGFIVLSAAIFLTINSPVTVLIWAGTINGFILPVGLALILLASRKKKLLGEYVHPLALQIAGWAVVVIMLGFTVATLLKI
jgi:Mn2+/Fe2+ NRAMP family transporter